MIEYPKIETLYNRDEKTHKILTAEVRLTEFSNIRRWHVTEKVDGTNVRVCYGADDSIRFSGRTDNAQMPVRLLEVLGQIFTKERLEATFGLPESEVVLFGEGYGEKIQNGGNYRRGIGFRLFDVLVGEWWLEPEAVKDVAAHLGIDTVPYLGEIDILPTSPSDIESLIPNRDSLVAQQDSGQGCEAEGIVARTVPLLLTRRGERLMWKLKFRDFG